MEREKFILDAPGRLDREPIACTLDGHGFRQRLEDFRAAFRRGYLGGERTATGVRWRFRAAPGLEDDLRSLAGRERECCRFFTFEIQTAGDEIWWDSRVDDPDALPLLEELFSLAGSTPPMESLDNR